MKIQQRIRRAARAVTAWLQDAGTDTRGNVAMMFGLALPALVMVVVGGIDINRVSTAKVGLQDALDAASLAAARSPYTAAADIQRVGMDALKANLAAYPTVDLIESETTFVLNSSQVVVADAKISVQTLVANIVLPPYGQLLGDELPVGVHSEVNRATKDIEVSLVLDVTGSMAGNRLRDLKSAANTLVDLVVQDQQNINRTRMALVPYSMGVNPGSYINTVRGTPKGSTSITDASWASPGWSAKAISAISIASPGTITANAHGLATGDYVWITAVANTSFGNGNNLSATLNNLPYRVVRTSANTFTLEKWNGTSWVSVSTTGNKAHTANTGTFRKCQLSTCEVVVTSNSHGLSNGNDVQIRGVNGMAEINNALDNNRTDSTAFQPNLFTTVTRLTANTFSLNGKAGTNVSAYTSGGTVQCLEQGCLLYKFDNLSNNHPRVRPILENNRSCVSERVGAQAYTDASASTAPVGLAYASTDNPCLGSIIQPLTDNRETLKAQINGYSAVGSTAGQIGVGWGWYMISPTFGSIFPANSRPAPYSTDDSLLKVVIIMTDGEFNTPYCNGVVAGAVSGSGATTQHINCAATNGNPFAQAVTMCNAMKSRNIIIYTVGFDIGSGTGAANVVDTAKEVMEQCATDPTHVYLPENGTSLQAAFGAIGRSISQLRITR